jgi:hypothetical protein
MLFCIQRKKQPSIWGSQEGLMTISRMGDQIYLIIIMNVLPQNWYKTA